jgi:hypothetical protein
MVASEGSESDSDRSLLSLRPVAQPEHEIYFQHLSDALRRDDPASPLNIALSGGYGTGKSSVLARLAEEFEDKVVRISFSTLGAVRRRSRPERKETILDAVQKEIVKQILYTAPPSKVSSSRFDRLDKFNWPRAIFLSAAVGLAVAAVIFATRAGQRLEDVTSAGGFKIWVGYILGILVFTAVGCVTQLFLQGVRLRRVSSGSTSIELAESSQSYFDQYLDEIVYFFQQTGRDIVLLEDLDRFDDSSIFEELRELNTLLNGASQVGQPVRFVYAVKDSLFEAWSRVKGDDSELAQSAAVRRTKFFDLIVPIVPFIGQRSAREHLSELLSDSGVEIPDELIALVSRKLPEMRLLKNIVNEYHVFDRVAVSDDVRNFDNISERFAMVVFKNLRPLDFENIQFGDSALNTIYDVSRRLIVAETTRLSSELVDLSGNAARSEAVAQLAMQAGRELVEHVKRTLSVTHSENANFTYRLSGALYDSDQTTTEAFWDAVYGSSDQTIHVEHQSVPAGDFPLARLIAELELPSSADQWNAAGRERIEEHRAEIGGRLAEMRRATFSKLVARVDLVDSPTGKNLRSLAIDAFGESTLPFELVARGFIDQHFNLYVTRFKGLRLTEPAATYLMQTIERQLSDPEYEVGGAEVVDALVEQAGVEFLGEPAALNLDIFNALLGRPMLEPAIERLSASSTPDPFVALYMEKGDRKLEFVQALASRWPGIFVFLAESSANTPEELKEVATALRAAKTEVRYDSSNETRQIIGNNLSGLSRLLNGSDWQTQVATVLSRLGVEAPSLESIDGELARALATSTSFVLNAANLKYVANASSISLELLLGSPAFSKAVALLDEFEDLAEREAVPTISDPNSLQLVLAELSEAGIADVRRLLEGAAEEVKISTWDEISASQKTSIIASGRVAHDFELIEEYVADFGMDGVLVEFLESVRALAFDEDEIAAARRLSMATRMINSDMDLDSKVRLFESLELTEPLAPGTVNLRDGDFVRVLVEAGALPDAQSTWAAMTNMEWETKVGFLRVTETIDTWLVPSLLTGSEVELLFGNNTESLDSVQGFVVRNLASFEPSGSAWSGILRFAAENGLALSDEEIIRATRAGADTALVLSGLLAGNRPYETFVEVLDAAGGDYERVARLGYGQIRFHNDDTHRALGETLAGFEIINVEPDGEQLKFNLRHPK